MTIKDLVRLSGYSLGTVSRVLNDQPNVSEKARKAVLAVAEEYGFQVNTNAQSLKQQKSKSVLAVVKGRDNELFSVMVERLQTLFSATEHPLIVDYIDEADDEVLRAGHICRERKPAGILFLGGSNANFSRGFSAITVPAAVVTNDASALAFENLSSVYTDDVSGAECAVDYLVSSGHTMIAVLGGDRETSDTSRKRFEGCLRALEKHGLDFDEAMYRTVRYSYECGYKAMDDVLSSAPDTAAVFAMSDVIAIGAMRCAADRGFCVPADVSVIGYDGLKIGRYYIPRLTTVSQNVDMLAQQAFEIITDCIDNGTKARHVSVPFTLSLNDSVREVHT